MVIQLYMVPSVFLLPLDYLHAYYCQHGHRVGKDRRRAKTTDSVLHAPFYHHTLPTLLYAPATCPIPTTWGLAVTTCPTCALLPVPFTPSLPFPAITWTSMLQHCTFCPCHHLSSPALPHFPMPCLGWDRMPGTCLVPYLSSTTGLDRHTYTQPATLCLTGFFLFVPQDYSACQPCLLCLLLGTCLPEPAAFPRCLLRHSPSFLLTTCLPPPGFSLPATYLASILPTYRTTEMPAASPLPPPPTIPPPPPVSACWENCSVTHLPLQGLPHCHHQVGQDSV